MATIDALVLPELSGDDLLSCVETLRRGPLFFFETILAALACDDRRHLPTGAEGRYGVAMMDDII